MRAFFRNSTVFLILAAGATAVGLLFYYELNFYASIPVISMDSYYLYYEAFLLALVPLTIPVYLRHLIDTDRNFVEMPYRKFLRISFGVLWIFDGVLQMQPGLITLFDELVLIPLLGSSPIVDSLTRYAINVWNINPPVFDLIASLIQVYLGALILIFRKGPVLVLSLILALIWSLLIWTFGEGFGGILSPSATMLTGSPGSALIYALASFILILSIRNSYSASIEKTVRVSMILLFGYFAIMQALPSNGFWGSLPVSLFLAPFGFLSSLITLTQTIAQYPLFWNGVFVVSMTAITVLWIAAPRIAAYVSLAWGIFIWYVYQGLGIFGIMSTDPNTGLPVVLVSAAYILFHRMETLPRQSSNKEGIQAA